MPSYPPSKKKSLGIMKKHVSKRVNLICIADSWSYKQRKSDSGTPNIPHGFERALKSHAWHRSSTALKFGGQLPVFNF